MDFARPIGQQSRGDGDHAHGHAGGGIPLIELAQNEGGYRLHPRRAQQDRAHQFAKGNREDQNRSPQAVGPQ